MNNGKLRIVGCLAGLAGVLLTGSAFAQDAAPAAAAPAAPPEPAPAPAAEPAAATADASAGGNAQVGMALPGAAPQAAAVAGNSDHDSVVGRLAVGYLGRNGVAIGAGVAPTVVPTPVVGIRYWLSDMLGIDAGIGFGLTSGSAEMGDVSSDNPGWHLFMLHGGVPLSLASAGHFSFQIVPELNVGFAGASFTPPMGEEVSVSGFHLDVGARAGAEVQFGFIDVPQLSLQGGIGLRLNMDSTSAESAGVENSTSATSISTTVNGDPWDIFTSSISALYYF